MAVRIEYEKYMNILGSDKWTKDDITVYERLKDVAKKNNLNADDLFIQYVHMDPHEKREYVDMVTNKNKLDATTYLSSTQNMYNNLGNVTSSVSEKDILDVKEKQLFNLYEQNRVPHMVLQSDDQSNAYSAVGNTIQETKDEKITLQASELLEREDFSSAVLSSPEVLKGLASYSGKPVTTNTVTQSAGGRSKLTWDCSAISENATKLQKASESLLEVKTLYAQLQDSIRESWQSDAANVFLTEMSLDTSLVGSVADNALLLADVLNGLVGIYSRCQEDVTTTLDKAADILDTLD